MSSDRKPPLACQPGQY
jgi:hypothetical protein